MRCDFGGFEAHSACLFEIFPDLLAARARCVEVLLRVAFDLRRATTTRGDFVAKLAKPVGRLRTGNCGRELLGRKQALWLERAI